MFEPSNTEIGIMKDGEYVLRHEPVTDLMRSGDWLGVMALTFIGRTLREEERILFAACLIGAVDHGVNPPSAQVARTVARSGKPLAESVAAGLLTLGLRHGNAASAATVWFGDQVAMKTSVPVAVSRALTSGMRLPGFGHSEYTRDPRAVVLTDLAKVQLVQPTHVRYALDVAEELTRQKGTLLYLNIDGAIGAVVADLGWPSAMADTIFLVARTVGLSAHVHEVAAEIKRSPSTESLFSQK